MRITTWFSENLVLTFCLLLLAAISAPAWWLLRRLLSSPQSPPRELANRWFLHAHIARLAESLVAKQQPISTTLDFLFRAAGKPRSNLHSESDQARALDAQRTNNISPQTAPDDVVAHAWLGRETVLALVALRDGAMPMDQVRHLLASIASQMQRMGDVRSARNVQWLPMIVATTAGIVVVSMYVGLIYGPWLTLFHALTL